MKLTLKAPVAHGEVTITELNFREEIVAGDLRGVAMRDPMQYDELLKIAGRLCAQPDAVMNKLSLADTLGVVEAVGSFFDGGLKTGKKP